MVDQRMSILLLVCGFAVHTTLAQWPLGPDFFNNMNAMVTNMNTMGSNLQVMGDSIRINGQAMVEDDKVRAAEGVAFAGGRVFYSANGGLGYAYNSSDGAYTQYSMDGGSPPHGYMYHTGPSGTSIHHFTAFTGPLGPDFHNDMDALRTNLNTMKTNLKSNLNLMESNHKTNMNTMKSNLKADLNTMKANLKANRNTMKANLKSNRNKMKANLKANRNKMKANRNKMRSNLKANRNKMKANRKANRNKMKANRKANRNKMRSRLQVIGNIIRINGQAMVDNDKARAAEGVAFAGGRVFNSTNGGFGYAYNSSDGSYTQYAMDGGSPPHGYMYHTGPFGTSISTW
ncbi:hypothetical protein MAR_014184 [Mya arenaria]|uniref:Uncharacterized protein n=1 Tax=Mya arenaria TaxID=6604 RepID=A0ABY7G1Z2_MYAAR|nr:hypothetical protein MAR_014184 [Mya arenaria]